MKPFTTIQTVLLLILFATFLYPTRVFSQKNFNVSAGPVFSNFDINDNNPNSKTSNYTGYEVGIGVSYGLFKPFQIIEGASFDINLHLSNSGTEYYVDNETYVMEFSSLRNEFEIGIILKDSENGYIKINSGVYLKYMLNSKFYHATSRIVSDAIDLNNLKTVVSGLNAEVTLGQDKLSLSYGITHDIQNSFFTGPISLKSTVQSLKLKFYF